MCRKAELIKLCHSVMWNNFTMLFYYVDARNDMRRTCERGRQNVGCTIKLLLFFFFFVLPVS